MQDEQGETGAKQEWRAHWGLVLSATIGLSLGTVASSSLGLFMAPLQHEFGWKQAEIALGLTISAIIGIPLSPLAGALVDRFGPRRIALPGLVLASLGLAGFGVAGPAFATWLTVWIVYALAATLIRTTVWTTAVSAAFTANRGLALAFVLGGIGIAQALAPSAARVLIDEFGWRGGYVGLALSWGGLAFVLALLFFRDPLSQRKAAPAASRGSVPGGLTVAQAMRSPPLLRISLAILLQAIVGTAAIVYLVPILGTAGVSRQTAASVAILLGVGSMAGKLLTGWLADRWCGSVLTCSCFAFPALGYLLLYQGGPGLALLALGTFLVGYGSGSAFQMVGYLFTHYAGLLHFGKIFGLLGSVTGIGAGIGPPLAGFVFDTTGGYSLFLAAAVAQGIVSALVVIRLGPFPRFAPAG